MRTQRSIVREASYKSKDLVVGYQILMLKGQHETQKHLISPANPAIRIDAHDEAQGLHSTLDLRLGEDMALELHRNAVGVPALLDGKAIVRDVQPLEHGAVLQIGSELIKVRKIQTKLGAHSAGTQRVYSNDRRMLGRSASKIWFLSQGLIALAIVASAVAFKVLTH